MVVVKSEEVAPDEIVSKQTESEQTYQLPDDSEAKTNAPIHQFVQTITRLNVCYSLLSTIKGAEKREEILEMIRPDLEKGRVLVASLGGLENAMSLLKKSPYFTKERYNKLSFDTSILDSKNEASDSMIFPSDN